MKRSLPPIFSRSLLLPWAALALSLAGLGNTCGGGPPPALPPPARASFELRSLSTPRLFGVDVDLAGGSARLRRRAWAIDTRVGPFAVDASYDSSDGEWAWSFEMLLGSGVFVDDTGAAHDVSALAPGDTIPGTHWVYESATSVKTKGGLLYEFGTHGALETLRWISSSEPRIAFTTTVVLATARVSGADQCFDGACVPLFAVTRDAAGRITSVSDRAGRIASCAYDSNGDLTVARDPLDHERDEPGWRYEYTNGLLTALTSSEGERTEIAYTAGAVPRVAAVTQIDGGTSPAYSIAYHAGAPVSSTVLTDPDEGEWLVIWDGRYRMLSSRSPSGDTEVYSWGSPSGLRLARYRDAAGIETHFGYAGGDDPVSVLEASGNLRSVVYAPQGELRDLPRQRPIASLTDSLGVIEQRSYDASGRLVARANGAGESESLTYFGNLVASVTSADGVVRSFGYDPDNEHGHPDTIATGALSSEARSYDAVGNLLTGENLSSPVAPGGPGIVARAFDADRNLASLILEDLASDPDSQYPTQQDTLTLVWRSDHRLEAIRRPGGGDSEFDYDARGNLSAQRDRVDGQWRTTSYAWDDRGNLVETLLPNGMRRTTGYDADGRPVVGSDERGGAVEASLLVGYVDGRVAARLDTSYAGLPPEEYGFDAAGRIDTILYPEGESIGLEYDLRSRVTREIFYYDSGLPMRTLDYGYDAAGRLREVRDNGALLTRNTWLDGRLGEEEFGNGLKRTYAYDPDTGTRSDSVIYDAAGLPIASTVVRRELCSVYAIGQSPCVRVWTSSPLGPAYEEHKLASSQLLYEPLAGPRLGFWNRTSAPQAPDDATFYAYDVLGNNTSRVRDGGTPAQRETQTHVYNTERNRLLRSVDDASGSDLATFAYDEAGFVSERSGVALTWNAGGRITSIGTAHTFAWDMDGRPTRSTQNGTTVERRFGGRATANAAGVIETLHVGMATIDLASAARVYRHDDFRGNIAFVSDESGAIVTHYTYRGYARDEVLGLDADPVRFAHGVELDDALVIVGARLYDQSVGRFLAPDPLLQVVNQFAYTTGNPVALMDQSGMEMTPVQAAALIHAGEAFKDYGAAIGSAGAITVLMATPGSVGVGTALIIVGGGLTIAGATMSRIGWNALESQERARLGPLSHDLRNQVPPSVRLGRRLGTASDARIMLKTGAARVSLGGGCAAPARSSPAPGVRGLLELSLPLAIGLAVVLSGSRRRGLRRAGLGAFR